MSKWFDTLYRSAQEPEDSSGEKPQIDHEGTAPDPASDTVTGSKRQLHRPPPLTGIPNRWSLEVQKVVFHLRPVAGDEKAPHHIVFSSLQKGPGVTTISYLVAHHIATEGRQQRVLYVNFNPQPSAPAMPNADATLYIGEDIEADADFHHSDSTLTNLAIRSNSTQADSIASGWLYEFISYARQHYDWILVDAPPFFGSPETYSVAKACDGVVLVLKSGETRYPAMKALVSDLDSLGIPIIGTVLNFRQYPLPKWLLRYV